MAIYSEVNHTKWMVRVKLVVLAVVIYILWDINGGMFDIVFSFLGTTPCIGAGNGSVWEWYFRTSLDHWSAFLGMIFALNFPLAEQFFTKAKGIPLVLTAIGLGTISVWWFLEYYMKSKLEYNLTHSYSAIIPLTSYIFFRNITPGIRSGVSGSLHDLGKTTLETYLLQHHVWLTSNAKTLLNITPGYPWINFALATVLFFVLAKELYRLTMTLRGMIMPDDRDIALRNTVGMGVVLAIAFAAAWVLHTMQTSLIGIFVSCLLLSLVAVMVIIKLVPSTGDTPVFQSVAVKFVGVVTVLCVLGIVAQFLAPDLAPSPSSTALTVQRQRPVTFEKSCFESISRGRWEKTPCISSNQDRTAYCGTQRWVWTDSHSTSCPLASISSSTAASMLRGKKIVFVGDSLTRLVYHAFNRLLDPEKYRKNYDSALKHSDMQYKHTANNITVHFLWSPMMRDVIPRVMENNTILSASYLVVGAALWDALHERDLPLYAKHAQELAAVLPKKAKVAWVQPTGVVDALLNSPEKQKYMTENIVESYRDTMSKSLVKSRVDVFIDSRNVSLSREETSTDGVHYGEDIYAVIAQMLMNGYALHYPELMKKPAKKAIGGKPTGPMSLPGYGAAVLALSVVMIFTMDSFLGVGFLSQAVCGRFPDWEAAYGPLLKKLGVRGIEEAEDSKSLIGNEEKEIALGTLVHAAHKA
eukprot:CAMPEP_0182439996 /NCGR_PEP_ID=MMETSP1167-20130531/86781_1 /TAXON_ID=2988 /ORGANISM="Mallomonas Sp, Strain CCMP3275" /LENGTH=695 /DNA_ID=CAMNT_0024633825 /DNA_START=723 /DNA_END=2810 /DNA_ORIENTATION=-